MDCCISRRRAGNGCFPSRRTRDCCLPSGLVPVVRVKHSDPILLPVRTDPTFNLNRGPLVLNLLVYYLNECRCIPDAFRVSDPNSLLVKKRSELAQEPFRADIEVLFRPVFVVFLELYPEGFVTQGSGSVPSDSCENPSVDSCGCPGGVVSDIEFSEPMVFRELVSQVLGRG